jgi:RNA polymerase sigma-70 factor (ECF subfamily)
MEASAHIGAVVNHAGRHVERRESPVASDTVLVARAAAGDEEAFALLYHRYEQDAWSLASFKLRDRHEAEDAVQETFLRAYRSLRAFRGGESARPWLLTICRNVCLDRLRTRVARGTVFLDDHTGPEPAAPEDDPDGRIDLRRALAAMPHDDVEAFFLVDVLGCRSHEAARIVGLRASSTLRSRLDRARRFLAEAVSDDPVVAPSAP